MVTVDKAALRQAVIAELEKELKLQTEAAHASRSEATDEESRAEDRFDMRSQSAAYLAAGQAKLAAEIAEAIAAYRNLPLKNFAPGEVAAAGAVITLRAGAQTAVYLLGPQHGGLEVRAGGTTVTVVTAASPVGRQFVGKMMGDVVSLPGRRGLAPHVIAAIE